MGLELGIEWGRYFPSQNNKVKKLCWGNEITEQREPEAENL